MLRKRCAEIKMKGDKSMIKRFERSAKYDKGWIDENKMGPNPIWLMEEPCEHMKLEKGMKILDLGCGKAITSIFLAKEFGACEVKNGKSIWYECCDRELLDADINNYLTLIKVVSTLS